MTLKYEIEFDGIPSNLDGAIEDSLQMRDSENCPRSLKSSDWSAIVVLMGKMVEVI